MKEQLLRDLYKKRGASGSDALAAVNYVEQLENYLIEHGVSLETAETTLIAEYITGLIEASENTIPRFLALARYFYLIDSHDVYIYFTKVFGGIGVIENIKKRLVDNTDEETCDLIFNELNIPVLGTSSKNIPAFTSALMKRLKSHLSPSIYRYVLAGNNHGIPQEAMQDEKTLYEEAENIDEYLKGRHEWKVAELQQYCDEGKVWFEQKISQEMVDLVKSNQEILSAVRKGNKLYVTKIPFDGIKYIESEDPVLRSYYACHCPFARERILDESKDNVDADWCYCSAGYAKFPFEVIFGEELDVEMLQSALKGDPVCRFAITLPSGIK